MAPDALNAVRMHEGCLAVHKLPRMADRHPTVEIVVASPLVREDETFRSGGTEDSRTEGSLLAIRNTFKQALFVVSGDSSKNPLLREHGFIPFGDAGDGGRFQRFHQSSEQSVELLTGLAVTSQELRQICTGHPTAQREEFRRVFPFFFEELTAAANGIRSTRESPMTVRTAEALSPSRILATPHGAGSSAMTTENSVCSHTEEEKLK